jgi:hypothetical protein
MADDGTRKLGPGVLKIGATGTEIDVSCLVNSCTIAADKNEGDSTTKLCGTVKPGAITYDYHMDGNVDVDSALSSGLFALSQSAAGTQQDFTYTPNDEIIAPATAATTATGKLVIDPLDFGGDTMGEVMTSDFSFTVVGQPVYTYADGTTFDAAAEAEAQAQEATSGQETAA